MTKTFKDYLEESGLQYYTGVKKHGKEYMDKAAKAGREGASQEELGRIKDKYSKAEKESIGEEGVEDDEFDPRRVKANVMKHLVDMYNDAKKDGGYTSERMRFALGNLLHDLDMAGYMDSDYSDIQGFFHKGIDIKADEKINMGLLKKAYAQAKNLPDDDNESLELDRIKTLAGASIDETYDDDDDFYKAYGEMWYNEDDIMDEAEYQGRKVKLGKPMQGDVKKFKVYVKDPKTGNTKKVNFGHGGSSVKGKAMSIKKSNPARRKSFRARHNCDNPGPRTKARYWSCRKW